MLIDFSGFEQRLLTLPDYSINIFNKYRTDQGKTQQPCGRQDTDDNYSASNGLLSDFICYFKVD